MAANIIRTTLATAALAGAAVAVQAQQTTPPGSAADGGRPGSFAPSQTDLYRSNLVRLGDVADGALLFEPTTPAADRSVAVVTTYGPPAAELAGRGYRVVQVPSGPPGSGTTPFAAFRQTSDAIALARALPGVRRVVVLAWGGGATGMILYADVAANGPAACRGPRVIAPCTDAQVSGIAKPDGIVLLDPGLGGAYKVLNIDPGYDGGTRTRAELDWLSAANGYDAATGTASYAPAFRARYFAAQSAINEQTVRNAIARVRALDAAGGGDEPLVVPGAVNTADLASLHHADLSLLSRTKRAHTLLKADGTAPQVVIRSVRASTGPVGEAAVAKARGQNDRPRDRLTVRQFLANDAVRTTPAFKVTADDVVGIDWHSSNAASPAQAEGIRVPALVLTNTCFQFVTPSEIVFDHLASRDKTYVGIEGSDHFLGPCKPEYGDTRKRLFDFVAGWLAGKGRFLP